MVGFSSIPATSFPNIFFLPLFSSLLSRSHSKYFITIVMGSGSDKRSGLFYLGMGSLLTCNHFPITLNGPIMNGYFRSHVLGLDCFSLTRCSGGHLAFHYTVIMKIQCLPQGKTAAVKMPFAFCFKCKTLGTGQACSFSKPVLKACYFCWFEEVVKCLFLFFALPMFASNSSSFVSFVPCHHIQNFFFLC